MKNKLTVLILLIIVWLIPSCNNQSSSAHGSQRPYVILVSIDGFRHDYAEMYGAQNLLKIAEHGVKAESLIPSYPTKTFPNHYSIITGLYPDHHGIVDNYFYDPDWDEMFSLSNKNPDNGKWFGGRPIWELVNENGLLSASYFWIGSDMKINGQIPSYYKPYKESTINSERVNQVVDWIELPESERPQFITLYFSDVDTQGHNFGPDSEETKAAVLEVDEQIGKLYNSISALDYPVNLVIVSDHGQTTLDESKTILINELFEQSENIKYIPRNALLMLYLNDSLNIDPLYQKIKSKENNQFTTYKKEDIPKHLHFGENKRVGDILLISNPPYSFTMPNTSISKGTHGYDAYSVRDMHGVFYAIGPSFKSGYTQKSFENINIYPLITRVLRLNYDSTLIDGRLEGVSGMLK